MEYVLITDSTVDLGYEYMEKNNVPFLTLCYIVGEKEYLDDMEKTTDIHKFYENMREGKEMAVTTQINTEEYKEYFKKYLNEGKDIIYLCFSSGLSGSFNSALNAEKELKQQYPHRKIAIIDSLAASMGQGLIIRDAVEKRDSGADFEELLNHIKTKIPQTNHWFTVDDLNHLYRGGRVSKTAAVLGTVLNIKPILNVDDEGHLIPREKVRGRKKALLGLVDKVKKYIVNSENQTILISHGDIVEDAVFVGNEIEKRMKIKGLYYSNIGPVIGAHSGPGTVAVFFFGKSKEI
ncbi:MAG: DegV family protein [Clostridiales bacterium]